jgi:hypothetical protein
MLYGKTYVADDLTLAGRGARAELKGSYCGFGAGTDAGTSSAIVINGKNTVFDMDGLDRLILAGVSFLDTPGSAVRTGESVSVKSNQLAYLADGSCLTLTPLYDTDGDGELDAGESAGTVSGGNPYVWTGNMLLYSVADQTLWTIGGVSRRLSDYGAEVRPVLKNIVGAENYQLAYFFLNFSSQAKANEYFRDFLHTAPTGSRSTSAPTRRSATRQLSCRPPAIPSILPRVSSRSRRPSPPWTSRDWPRSLRTAARRSTPTELPRAIRLSHTL